MSCFSWRSEPRQSYNKIRKEKRLAPNFPLPKAAGVLGSILTWLNCCLVLGLSFSAKKCFWLALTLTQFFWLEKTRKKHYFFRLATSPPHPTSPSTVYGTLGKLLVRNVLPGKWLRNCWAWIFSFSFCLALQESKNWEKCFFF